MTSYTELEEFNLQPDQADLLCRCFTEPPRRVATRVYTTRPDFLELSTRITVDLAIGDNGTPHPPHIMEAVLRSIERAWDDFDGGFIRPSQFLRASPFSPYRIVLFPDIGGRGIIASRDLKAEEVVFRERPIMILPPGAATMPLFLTLPQKALGAILLLHNNMLEFTDVSSFADDPCHRLMELLWGVLSTNGFGTNGGPASLLLLTGSLFNHSNAPNVGRYWDGSAEKMVFGTLRDIREGEELCIDYLPELHGQAKTDRLMKNYGISIL